MTAIPQVEEKTAFLSHDPSGGGESDFDVGGGNNVAAGNSTDATIETPAEDELIEITDIELVPARNADGTLQNWDYLTVTTDGRETVGAIRAAPFQLPYITGTPDRQQTLRSSLGVPVLRIDDTEPDLSQKNIFEVTCPKFNFGDEAAIRIQNDGTAISDSFIVKVTYRKFQGSAAQYRSAIGLGEASATIEITARNPYRGITDTFSRDIDVDLQAFDEMPGGPDAAPPFSERLIIAPTLDVATAGQNKRTAFNTDNVDESEDALWFNLSQDTQESYIVDHLSLDTTHRNPDPGIDPNLESTVFELDHRDDEDDTTFTTPDDITNELPAPMPMDGVDMDSPAGDMKQHLAGGVQPNVVPRRLWPREHLFRDKGGLAIVDDGNVIAAGSVRVGAWGFILNLQ